MYMGKVCLAMKYLVNSCEMKQYDRNTTEVFKIPSLLLMERAAVAFVHELKKHVNLEKKQVLVVCGTGNNGGDGLAVGRILKLAEVSTDIVLCGDCKKGTEQNKKQREILQAYRFEVLGKIPAEKSYDIVIDAVFGVGLARDIAGDYQKLIQQMNEMNAYKAAVDIPSGISADNGGVLGIAFKADLTITFAYDKVGMHLWPGNEYTGAIITAEIGINERSFLDCKPGVAVYEKKDLCLLPKRPSHSNKGTFGKLLVIAGSANMAGAALFSAKSAYAVGTGLVRVFTAEENRTIIQTALPEAILTTYPAKKVDLQALKDAMNWADVILCGPGIGTGDTAAQIVKYVLCHASIPVVFDADALNIISQDTSVLLKSQAEIVMTPHLGEMSRLTGDSVSCIQTKLIDTAEEFAREYHVICVLKDEHTITSVPYGQTYLNLSGNNGMATAGSGDVLAGILAGFMAQGMPGKEAAPLAVYLHGLSGDTVIAYTGTAGLMASDLIDGVREIFSQCCR